MSIASADSLEKRYGEDLVFEKVGFSLEQGDRVGLIGPNGSGKSSLMRILAGQDDRYEGNVYRRRGLSIGFLVQEPPGGDRRSVLQYMNAAHAETHRLEERLEALALELGGPAKSDRRQSLLDEYGQVQSELERRGGYDTDRRTLEALQGLRIPRDSWEDPVASLSGGQRTRLHLGRIILAKPQLLLLDEPTNYLDSRSLPWLIDSLVKWPGSLVAISHDTDFIERVANRIWELKHRRLDRYAGGYSHFLSQKTAREERHEREYKAQQEYIAKTEEFVRRFKAGQLSKQARGRETRLKRFMETQAVDRPNKHKDLRLRFPAAPRSGEIVARFHGLLAGYGPLAPVVRMEDLEIRRLDRVALTGPNGIGKSTLLRTLVGQLPPLSGTVQLGANVRIGYFAQHQVEDDFAAMDPGKSSFDLVRDAKSLQNEEVRSHLGLFQLSGEDVFRSLGTLSGGQKSRLAFAMLALEETNFLVLDEPMSHFDSSTALVGALQDYEGTILFISHDQRLVDQLASQVWEVSPQGGDQPAVAALRRDPSRMDFDWPEDADAAADREVPRPAGKRRLGPRLREASRQVRRPRVQEREDELVSAIDEIEGKMARVADRLAKASAAGDGDEIRRLTKTHAFLTDQAERRWAELAGLEGGDA